MILLISLSGRRNSRLQDISAVARRRIVDALAGYGGPAEAGREAGEDGQIRSCAMAAVRRSLTANVPAGACPAATIVL